LDFLRRQWRTKKKQSKENTFVGLILNAPDRIAVLREKEKEEKEAFERKEYQICREKGIRGGLIQAGFLKENERLTIPHLSSFLLKQNVMKLPKSREELLVLSQKALNLPSLPPPLPPLPSRTTTPLPSAPATPLPSAPATPLPSRTTTSILSSPPSESAPPLSFSLPLSPPSAAVTPLFRSRTLSVPFPSTSTDRLPSKPAASKSTLRSEFSTLPIPRSLQYPAVWSRNSCAFDSYFEANVGLYIFNPSVLPNPPPTAEQISKALDHEYGLPPYDSFEKCQLHIAAYRLNSSESFSSIKSRFHEKMNLLFGKNQHPLGAVGSCHHWSKVLENHPPANSLYIHEAKFGQTCPEHGYSEKVVRGSIVIIKLMPSFTFQESIDQYFLNETVYACPLQLSRKEKDEVYIDSCSLPGQSRILEFSNPPFFNCGF